MRSSLPAERVIGRAFPQGGPAPTAQTDSVGTMEPISTRILTDGAAGNERQAVALGGAMGLEPKIDRIALRAPWSWLAPHLRVGAWHALPASVRRAIAADPPRIVIGCGRAAALATAIIRARTGAFAIQILDPRAALDAWDLVVAPAHDGL